MFSEPTFLHAEVLRKSSLIVHPVCQKFVKSETGKAPSLENAHRFATLFKDQNLKIQIARSEIIIEAATISVVFFEH